MASKVPIHLVAGFLGAGKTTVIRAQLEGRSGERHAVIVNDFGEAALDETRLAEGEPFKITNIPGGCVCCTAPEGFVEALGAVLADQPDRIWIEPTGLARPQDLIDTLRRSPYAAQLEIQPVIVLLDPVQWEREENRELLHEQIGIADVLVATRGDLASATQRDVFRALAKSLWPAPLLVLESEHGKLPSDAFAWPEGSGPKQARDAAATHSHRHDSTLGFVARSWIWSPEVVFSHPRLRDALERGVASGLERFKGIFRTQEGVTAFEIAAGSLDERLSPYRRDSRADAIAKGDASALDALGNALAGATMSADELQLAAERLEIVLPDGRNVTVDRGALLELPDGIDDVAPLFPKRSGAAARVASLWRHLDLPREGSAVAVAIDGFASEAVPLSGLCAGVLLHSIEGAALPDKQGGPFRLLIPEGTPGVPNACANVKGLAKLVLRAKA